MTSLKKRWRRLEVRIQRNARIQGTLQRFFGWYLNFVYRTTRWEHIGLESVEADLKAGISRVVCCWHEQIALATYFREWDDGALTILVSQHADAQLIAQTFPPRGIHIVNLATSGDNTGALKQSLRILRRGRWVGAAVDGPMGPRGKVKPGALVIAGLGQVKVSPACYAISRKFRLNTWDKFIIPLPYSRGVMASGEGFVPPREMSEADLDAACQKLGTMIDDLTEQCEAKLRRKTSPAIRK